MILTWATYLIFTVVVASNFLKCSFVFNPEREERDEEGEASEDDREEKVKAAE